MENMRKITLKDNTTLIAVRAELVNIGSARAFGSAGKTVHTCSIRWTQANGESVQTSAFAYGATVEKIAEGMTLVATPTMIDGSIRMKLTSWQWNDGVSNAAFGDLAAMLGTEVASDAVVTPTDAVNAAEAANAAPALTPEQEIAQLKAQMAANAAAERVS